MSAGLHTVGSHHVELSRIGRRFHPFHIHLNTHRRIHVISDGSAYAVAHIPHTVKRHGERFLHQRFLTVEISLPMLIETIAQHGADTGIAERVVSEKGIIEITANGQRHLLAQRHGIHQRYILRKTSSEITAAAPRAEHRGSQIHIESLMEVPAMVTTPHIIRKHIDGHLTIVVQRRQV